MKLTYLTESGVINFKNKLWIDDVRPAPDDTWDIARTYDEAINSLSKNKYDIVSFDHDLGDFKDGRERTGYDVLLWLTEKRLNNETVPKNLRIHSANPVGRQRMQGVIDRYWR